MTSRRYLLFVPAALALASASAAPAQVEFPDREDAELIELARLPPMAGRGDVIRYTLHRGWGYNIERRARIAQAEWSYANEQPRIVMIEFEHRRGVWRIVSRREALMHPRRFDQLVRNVAAAAAVIGDRSNRGSQLVCSHSDSSRLDLRVPDQGGLTLSRSAHCSDDAPAVVAGELLTAAVELSLRLNWLPE